MVKNLPACRRPRFNHWLGKIPWRREWLPTPVFLPGEFLGQRSLVGYGPWGHSQARLSNCHFFTYNFTEFYYVKANELCDKSRH